MNAVRTEVKWALIFVGVTLVWMVLERAAGLHDAHIDKHMIFTNLFAIPAIAVYVLALREKKYKDLGGTMRYKQGLLSGVLISVIIAILSPLTQWITSTFITPHYFDNIIAYAVETGAYDSVEDAAAFFNLKAYILQSAIGALVMGVVTSTVVAFFLRSRAPQ